MSVDPGRPAGASAWTCPNPTAPSRRRAPPSARRRRHHATRRPRYRPRRSGASARGPRPVRRMAPAQPSSRLSPSDLEATRWASRRGTPGAVCTIVRPVHETTPTVHLIARPSIDVEGMRGYLRDVGGESWLTRRLQEAGSMENAGETGGAGNAGEAAGASGLNGGELLVEFGGRACYRSWEPGLNPNVTKIRTDQREYFANILRSGHGSVLEHASWSFALRNVSRVFTHELVRHRAGSAFSQESLRYVRLADIGFRVPPALEPVREQVLSIVEQLEEFQVSAAAELGIDAEGVPFHVKKEVTSALRRLAPIGLSTDIVWTANARTLRHVIEMRTAAGAEEELRLVFDQIARVMQTEAPGLFQDFVRQDDGSWVPEHRKV